MFRWETCLDLNALKKRSKNGVSESVESVNTIFTVIVGVILRSCKKSSFRERKVCLPKEHYIIVLYVCKERIICKTKDIILKLIE